MSKPYTWATGDNVYLLTNTSLRRLSKRLTRAIPPVAPSGSPPTVLPADRPAGPYVYPETYGAVGNGIADDSSAIETALATGGVVRLTSDKTYAVDSAITVSAAASLYAEGATLLHRAPNALISLLPGASLHAVGGDFNCNSSGRLALGLLSVGQAIRVSPGASLTAKWSLFRSPTGGSAITSATGDPAQLDARGCVFRDNAKIVFYNTDLFKVVACRWEGTHYAAVSLNSDDKNGYEPSNVEITDCYGENFTYIGFEIKYGAGLIFARNEVGGSDYMLCSFPNSPSCIIEDNFFASVRSATGYAVELPGNASDAIVRRNTFAGIQGKSVHFGMDLYGFAHRALVEDNTFTDCANTVTMFRGKRCVQLTLSGISGTFQRGDVVAHNGYEVLVAGYDAGRSLLFVYRRAPVNGRQSPNPVWLNGQAVTNFTRSGAATLTANAQVTGIDAALQGWSRGDQIQITDNMLNNSAPITHFESGTTDAYIARNISNLGGAPYRIIALRGDGHVVEDNKQYADAVKTPSGSMGIYLDTGTTDALIQRNEIYAAGRGSYLFTSSTSAFSEGRNGSGISLLDNKAFNAVNRPYDFQSAYTQFLAQSGNTEDSTTGQASRFT